MSSTTQARTPRPELTSTPSTTAPRLQRISTQRFTANSDLLSPQFEHDSDPQRLPRPEAAPSLAHIGSSQQQYLRPSSRQSLATFANSPKNSKDEDFQPEALWAEMQRTLAEVELSALSTSSSSQVFGVAHSKALEDLRTSQIALAKAWALSEVDEIGDGNKDKANSSKATTSARSSAENATISKADVLTSSPSKARLGTNTGRDAEAIHRRRTSSSASAREMAADLEAETEHDIQLAQKRRAANDRYFSQVSKGVFDVVAKLDDVANAMRSVEVETREIWDERSLASNTDNSVERGSLDVKTRRRAGTQGTTDSELEDGSSLGVRTPRTTVGAEGFEKPSSSRATLKQDGKK